MASPFSKRCLSLDLEVGREGGIRAIGAVRADTGRGLPPAGGDLAAALARLDDFADGASFLLGHKLIAFDRPHLRAAKPNLRLLRLPAVDTLRLSPLAFPRNPYHRLVKHYWDGGLRRGRRNDPELDARLALEVFGEQLEALPKAAPDLLAAWHWLCAPEPAGAPAGAGRGGGGDRAEAAGRRLRRTGLRLVPGAARRPPGAEAMVRLRGVPARTGARRRPLAALRQRHRLRRLDLPSGEREAGERPPRGLGQEPSVVDLDFRQRRQRLQVDLLARRGARIELSRDPGGEVAEPVDPVFAGQQQGGEPNGIEPLEGRALQGAVVQVEPVDIDARSHDRPRK